MKTSGKTILITDGDSGIGRALAESFPYPRQSSTESLRYHCGTQGNYDDFFKTFSDATASTRR